MDSRTIGRAGLQGKVLPELQQIAEELGVSGHQRLRKSDLIDAIVAKSSENGEGVRMDTSTTSETGTDGADSVQVILAPDPSGDGAADAPSSDGEGGAATTVTERPATGDQARTGPGGPEQRSQSRRPSREERRRERERDCSHERREPGPFDVRWGVAKVDLALSGGQADRLEQFQVLRDGGVLAVDG